MGGQSAVVIADVPVEVLIIANYINACITVISKTAEKVMMQVEFAVTWFTFITIKKSINSMYYDLKQ